MKGLLICPAHQPRLDALTQTLPLCSVPLLGKSLLEYWLEHLFTLGAKEVDILVADRPERVESLMGDGARWGLRVCVRREKTQSSLADARALRHADNQRAWLPEPHDVVLMDHLPEQPALPLLASYADWFAAVLSWLPRTATTNRIGVRELAPGIWVGSRAHLATDAEFHAPCWIGENTYVDSGAIIGPQAVLESGVFVGRRAQIVQSIVGPNTLVGQNTEIHASIASGSTLANWERDFCFTVPDDFLLCSLEPSHSPSAPGTLISRLAALAARLPAARFVEQFGHIREAALAAARRLT